MADGTRITLAPDAVAVRPDQLMIIHRREVYTISLVSNGVLPMAEAALLRARGVADVLEDDARVEAVSPGGKEPRSAQASCLMHEGFADPVVVYGRPCNCVQNGNARLVAVVVPEDGAAGTARHLSAQELVTARSEDASYTTNPVLVYTDMSQPALVAGHVVIVTLDWTSSAPLPHLLLLVRELVRVSVSGAAIVVDLPANEELASAVEGVGMVPRWQQIFSRINGVARVQFESARFDPGRAVARFTLAVD